MRGSPHSRTGAPPRGARLPGGQVTAPLCRGGYHPPVCPRNRWPRGARRLGAPSVGATCGRPPIEVAPSRGAPNGAPAATQRSGRRGERRPSGGNELSGLPGSERSAAWADDGAPISSRRNGGKEGAGVPPPAPQNGGSWRRRAVQTGQKPGAHRRPFSRRFRDRRCRALGGTHRDCPANLESRRAVPVWPAGPPSVPRLRNTEPVTEVGAPTATQRSGRRGEKEAQRRE